MTATSRIGPVTPLEWNRPYTPPAGTPSPPRRRPRLARATWTRSRARETAAQSAGRHSFQHWRARGRMYEAYFHLTRTPFTRGLPPAQLLSTPAMQEVGARLDYTARERRFAVLTGDVGAGKSTALRAFLARLPAHALYPTLCDRLAAHPAQLLSRGALPTRPASALLPRRRPPAIAPRAAGARRRRQAAGHRHRRGASARARHAGGSPLPPQLRRRFPRPARAVLAGQSELRRTLKLECFTAIAQRVSFRAHLPALTLEESAGYIQHHLTQAGAAGPLFTDAALRLIHAFAGGLPRQLNKCAAPVCCLPMASTASHRRWHRP